jgi:acyl-CoA thioester hydrolase
MKSQGESFRFTHEVEVRFKDIDVGGHAHHSHALVYVEEARAAYWRAVAGRSSLDEVDYILAEASLRYRQRILYPDRLRVGVRVSVLGKKHFEMNYEVRSGEGDLLVTATTTQVMYDYGAGRTKAVPEEVRSRIEAWDGPFVRGS